MIFDFRCKNQHVTEHWVTSDTRHVRCDECGEQADRMITGGCVVLDALSGDFPGATLKWARHHEQMAKKSSD